MLLDTQVPLTQGGEQVTVLGVSRMNNYVFKVCMRDSNSYNVSTH